MAGDMFLKIDGIDGESQDSKHTGEIDIDSFGLSMSQSGTMHQGSGGGGGKVSVGDLFITKKVDKATHALMDACATGAPYGEAIVTIRKAGGPEAVEYLVYTFKDVLITSYSVSGAKDGLDRIAESIAINFREYKVEYAEQNSDGTKGAVASSGYDIVGNVKV